MLEEVESILTYDNSLLDVLINYFLWMISLLSVCQVNYYFINDSINSFSFRSDDSNLLKCMTFPVMSQVGLFVFQVGLCLVVGCVGISIIWSANMGIICIILHYFHNRRERNGSLRFCFNDLLKTSCVVLAMCFAAWVYYAFVEEPLTTIAHISAYILGCLIATSYIKVYIMNDVQLEVEEYDESHGSLIN